MKLRLILISLILFSSSLVLLPTQAQTDLNFELKLALCVQDWRRAIQIIDQMKAKYPENSAALTLYRGRLLTLMNNRAKIPNWPPQEYCQTPDPSSIGTDDTNKPENTTP